MNKVSLDSPKLYLHDGIVVKTSMTFTVDAVIVDVGRVELGFLLLSICTKRYKPAQYIVFHS